MSSLTLRIESFDPQSGWQAAWHLDGGPPVAAPILITDTAAQAVMELGEQFLALFEGPGLPLTDARQLQAWGWRLHESWFQPVWEAVRPRFNAGPHDLLISSKDPRILNLPWELVELAPSLPVGCDAAWSLRRTSLERLAPSGGALRPGPLRILFLAAAPVDQPHLDRDREEDALQRATASLQGDVVVHFAETGGLPELAESVARFRPHVVHLCGHGRVDLEGRGVFAFEDERGRADGRDAASLAADVFRGSPVRCVFLNGCETSQAAVAGLCQALVEAGVPLALGWSANVADERAFEFTKEFYQRLVRGEPVAAAMAHARNAIRHRGRQVSARTQTQDATFALPQAYCSVPGGEVFDRSAPPESYAGPRTEYFYLPDGIKGLRAGFIGRRRQIQQLLPGLREGEITFAVITGIGGAGKSTLATRAVNRLHGNGFACASVRTPKAAPAEAARQTLHQLQAALEGVFLREGRADVHRLLTNGNLLLGGASRLPRTP